MTANWPFGELLPLRYQTLMIDPPWAIEMRSEKGYAKSPQQHYACMGIDALMALPVDWLLAPNCLALCWATWPMLPQALDLLKAWKLRYSTGGCWVKRTSGGKLVFGTGYWLRSASEPFLIATLGSPRQRSRAERNVIEALRREHSRKPEEAYSFLERLTDGPRAELFSRQRRPGWDSWGLEADKFDPPAVAAAG